MSKIGFFDPYGNIMAQTEGVVSIMPVYAYSVQTMALKIDDIIVARAEDVDGLRWVVEAGMVKILDRDLVLRATLGDNARVFTASFVRTLE